MGLLTPRAGRRPWRRWWRGPAPVLPGPLDAVAERWARLPPRLRTLLVVAVLVVAASAAQARILAAESRWGGTPVTTLVAVADTPVGAVPVVEARRLPPAAVPPGIVAEVPDGARLSLALPRGSVLTAAHLDARGPAAGLPPELRVLPVPVEAGWDVRAGGWVDVWVLGTDAAPARRVARSRPVLRVRADDSATTALVGLDVDEVGEATTALAIGRVLLAHAPPPRARADPAADPTSDPTADPSEGRGPPDGS